jgi:hypothetical protein
MAPIAQARTTHINGGPAVGDGPYRDVTDLVAECRRNRKQHRNASAVKVRSCSGAAGHTLEEQHGRSAAVSGRDIASVIRNYNHGNYNNYDGTGVGAAGYSAEVLGSVGTSVSATGHRFSG